MKAKKYKRLCFQERVIIAPTLEKLYIRGYLLKRMPVKLKGCTELIHIELFADYHIWSPWMFVTRTIEVLTLIYIVKKERKILLGIIIHCSMN